MYRYILSRFAGEDLDELSNYLKSLPVAPSLKIGRTLQNALNLIAQYPYQGQSHSGYTRLFGQEVRSRLAGPYRIFYKLDKPYPEILAILHGKRDIAAILATRLT